MLDEKLVVTITFSLYCLFLSVPTMPPARSGEDRFLQGRFAPPETAEALRGRAGSSIRTPTGVDGNLRDLNLQGAILGKWHNF